MRASLGKQLTMTYWNLHRSLPQPLFQDSLISKQEQLEASRVTKLSKYFRSNQTSFMAGTSAQTRQTLPCQLVSVRLTYYIQYMLC